MGDVVFDVFGDCEGTNVAEFVETVGEHAEIGVFICAIVVVG